jgi:hypothetical protein
MLVLMLQNFCQAEVNSSYSARLRKATVTHLLLRALKLNQVTHVELSQVQDAQNTEVNSSSGECVRELRSLQV